MQRDLGNYATDSQLMTVQSNVAKNYLLKKDLNITGIKNNLAVVLGGSYFTGTDGMISDHIYPPISGMLSFHSESRGKTTKLVEKWTSSG